MAKSIQNIELEITSQSSTKATGTNMIEVSDAQFNRELAFMVKAGMVNLADDGSWQLNKIGEAMAIVADMINTVLDRKDDATDDEIVAELSFIEPEVVREALAFSKEFVKDTITEISQVC